MRILKATAEHIEDIIRLIEQLISELSEKPHHFAGGGAVAFLDHALRAEQYHIFLAMNDQRQSIGLITAGESGAVYAGGRFGIIHEFYILPEHRGHGLGHRLLEAMKQTALDLQWNRLEVGAPAYPKWKRTRQFYLQEQFIEIGPRLKWVIDQAPSR